MMNARAVQLGLTHTHFAIRTGWMRPATIRPLTISRCWRRSPCRTRRWGRSCRPKLRYPQDNDTQGLSSGHWQRSAARLWVAVSWRDWQSSRVILARRLSPGVRRHPPRPSDRWRGAGRSLLAGAPGGYAQPARLWLRARGVASRAAARRGVNTAQQLISDRAISARGVTMFPLAHAWLMDRLVARAHIRPLSRLRLARYALRQPALAYGVAAVTAWQVAA